MSDAMDRIMRTNGGEAGVMADDARLAELREKLLTALEVAGPMTPYMERLLIGELLPVVSAWAEQESARRAAEELRAAADVFARGGGPSWHERDLRARAAALTPASEEKL